MLKGERDHRGEDGGSLERAPAGDRPKPHPRLFRVETVPIISIALALRPASARCAPMHPAPRPAVNRGRPARPPSARPGATAAGISQRQRLGTSVYRVSAGRRPLQYARPRVLPQRVAARRRRPQLAQTAPGVCPPREKSRKRRGEGQEDGLIRRPSRGRHTGFIVCASPSSASPWIQRQPLYGGR
jgi:hypothetical protein